MTVFTKLAASIFAPFNVDGSAREPSLQDTQVWGTEVESVINTFLSTGGLIFASKTTLDADLAHVANSMAWVVGDLTVENNGVYMKTGASGAGSWTRVADLPYSFIIATDAGAGTANAIQATTTIPVSESALIWMSVFEANTASPVTVSFNSGAALTIKTNAGNDPAIGGLVAGMIVMGIVSGSTFRLVSDQTSAAIQAAAEAAQGLAETWAEGTLPGGAGTKSSKEWALVAQGAVTYNRASARGTINAGVGPYNAGVSIGSVNNIDIKVGGVIFDHDLYTISGTTFTFLTDPGAGQEWESLVHTEVRQLGAPSDGTVGTAQLQADAVTGDILAPDSVDEEHVTIGLLKRLGVFDQIVPWMHGAVGDGVADDTAALTAFITAAANATPEVDAFLSSGTYKITSELPNLLNPKGRLIGKGRPTIKYEGASAITDLLKLSDVSFNRYTQHISNIEIDGGPNAQGLLMLDKVNHVELSDIYLRNCHPGYQAMFTIFCVLGTFRNIICSFNNDGAFTSAPLNGLIVGSGTSAVTQTIACVFEKLIIEGTAGTGVGLINSWYNTFIGGTSEGCGGWGFDIKDYSRCNTFINVFCEVNTSGDFNVEGHNNTFINCEGMSSVTNSVLVVGDGNKFIGGRYNNFTIAGSADSTVLEGVEILGTYTNGGTNTVRR